MTKRLESLDILRGADMFLLTTLGPIVWFIVGWGNDGGIMHQFTHTDWVGFTAWDLIMPLFMFMSGVTIPFSFEKYRRGEAPKSKAIVRILRRFVCLWILGMIAQGNLLDFNPATIRLYSNTLQTIAVGYAASALIYLYCPKPKVHIGVVLFLLLAFWAVVMVIGGGDTTPDGNICEKVDRFVLGRFRDGASMNPDGTVHFADSYRYTWLLSSMTFIVTVMLGMLSSELIRSGKAHRSAILFIAGAACAAAGWIWGIEFPVIKKIWTSTMALVAGGYSMMLLAAFYWLIDVKGKGRKALGWLKIYGMNAILAYMLHWLLDEKLHLAVYIFVPILVAVLAFCYWKKIYLRV